VSFGSIIKDVQVRYSGSYELSLSKHVLHAPSPLPHSDIAMDLKIAMSFVTSLTSMVYPSVGFTISWRQITRNHVRSSLV